MLLIIVEALWYLEADITKPNDRHISFLMHCF